MTLYDLPFEILREIASYLPDKDLCECQQVSSVLRDVTTEFIYERFEFNRTYHTRVNVENLRLMVEVLKKYPGIRHYVKILDFGTGLIHESAEDFNRAFNFLANNLRLLYKLKSITMPEERLMKNAGVRDAFMRMLNGYRDNDHTIDYLRIVKHEPTWQQGNKTNQQLQVLDSLEWLGFVSSVVMKRTTFTLTGNEGTTQTTRIVCAGIILENPLRQYPYLATLKCLVICYNDRAAQPAVPALKRVLESTLKLDSVDLRFTAAWLWPTGLVFNVAEMETALWPVRNQLCELVIELPCRRGWLAPRPDNPNPPVYSTPFVTTVPSELMTTLPAFSRVVSLRLPFLLLARVYEGAADVEPALKRAQLPPSLHRLRLGWDGLENEQQRIELALQVSALAAACGTCAINGRAERDGEDERTYSELVSE